MIVNAHPVLTLLEDSSWRAHLVGSRYVGVFDQDKSDYDFMVECTSKDWFNGLCPWLKENGFAVEKAHRGYGPDKRLHDTDVWTCKTPGFPNVDILPMTPDEAAMRLMFFKAMKAQGHSRGGLLAKALKQEKQWATLWDCLAEFGGGE